MIEQNKFLVGHILKTDRMWPHHVFVLTELTHIDDGVSLDVVHVSLLKAQLPAVTLDGADDAGGDSVLQGERAPHRHHELTRPQV